MAILINCLSVIALISLLTACSSMSGNVVPEKGPTMEQVYDSEGDYRSTKNHLHSTCYSAVHANAVSHEFHKLPNPELKMYVYPHLAGKEQLPIPGYYTVFNGYTQDHYVLPNEIVRD